MINLVLNLWLDNYFFSYLELIISSLCQGALCNVWAPLTDNCSLTLLPAYAEPWHLLCRTNTLRSESVGTSQLFPKFATALDKLVDVHGLLVVYDSVGAFKALWTFLFQAFPFKLFWFAHWLPAYTPPVEVAKLNIAFNCVQKCPQGEGF